jgi:putative DNA primase/helicase
MSANEKEVGAPVAGAPTTITFTSEHHQASGVNTTGDSQNGEFADRVADLRRYLDALFGDRSGWLHLAIGYEPFVNSNGKYQFGNFKAVFFRWPNPEIDGVIDLILDESEKVDVYLCPYLMRGDKRAKGQAVDHLVLHADIDQEPFDSAKAEKLAAIGGFAISSGTPGHVHIYVPLTESISVEQHEALCIGLGKYIGGADPGKHSDNDILRPPGTLNHKPRVWHGKPPAQVRWWS